MSVRGYVFIRQKDDVALQDCLEIRRKLESIGTWMRAMLDASNRNNYRPWR